MVKYKKMTLYLRCRSDIALLCWAQFIESDVYTHQNPLFREGDRSTLDKLYPFQMIRH